MVPIIPHFALECKKFHGFNIDEKWPSYDENFIIEKEITYVIQINGKKRLAIKSLRDNNEVEIFKIAKTDKNIEKYLENKEIKKTIFVKNRLLNIII